MSPNTMPSAASTRALAPDWWGGCSTASTGGSDAAGGPVTCGVAGVAGGASGRDAVESGAASPLGDVPAACSVVTRHPPRIGPCVARSVPLQVGVPQSGGVRPAAGGDAATERSGPRAGGGDAVAHRYGHQVAGGPNGARLADMENRGRGGGRISVPVVGLGTWRRLEAAAAAGRHRELIDTATA